MKRNLISTSITESIHKFYEIGSQLGVGKFSVVKNAIEKATSKSWAVKIMKKSVVQEQDILKEIEIMNDAKHSNVIFLHEIFETDSEILLVLELVTGGELFDKIVERNSYTEEDASKLVNTLTKVIQFLHSKDIVHCDLKPENLLYSDNTDQAIIKLCDFGLSQRCPAGTQLRSLVGTLSYMAPEISSCTGYGKAVDMWSVGVIIYILLCGFPPFDETTGYCLEFPSPEWDNISDSAKGLIKSLLVLDPIKRLTAEQTLRHPWVSGANVGKNSILGTLKTLREFNTLRRSGTIGGTPIKQARGTVFELFPSLNGSNNLNQPGNSPIKPSPSMDSIPKIIDPSSILKISNELKLSSSSIPSSSLSSSSDNNDINCNIVNNNNNKLNSITEDQKESIGNILKKQLISSLEAIETSPETYSSSSSSSSSSPNNNNSNNTSPELNIDLGSASSDSYYQEKVNILLLEKSKLLKDLEDLRKENQTLRSTLTSNGSGSNSGGGSLSSTPNSYSPFLSSSFESKSKLISHIRNDSSGSYSSDSEGGKKDKSKYGVDRIVSDLLSEIDKLYLSKESMEKITTTMNTYKSKNQEKSLKSQYEKQKEKYKKLKSQIKKQQSHK